MRSFRFPGWTIVLMTVVLFGVIVAIDEGRTLSVQLASGTGMPTAWWALAVRLMAVFVLMFGAGLIGYGLIYALRQAGIQRFSSVQAWPRRK
jgi:hypothetical protein